MGILIGVLILPSSVWFTSGKSINRDLVGVLERSGSEGVFLESSFSFRLLRSFTYVERVFTILRSDARHKSLLSHVNVFNAIVEYN